MPTPQQHICSIVSEPEHPLRYISNAVENMLLNYLYQPQRERDGFYHKPLSVLPVKNARLAIDLSYHASRTGDTHSFTLGAAHSAQQTYEHCATKFHILREFYGKPTIHYPEKRRKAHQNNPAGRALFAQAYLQQVQHKKLTQLVPYAKGNNDLTAILYLDSLVAAVGGEEMMSFIQNEANVHYKTDGEINFHDLVADVLRHYKDPRNLAMHYRMEMSERAEQDRRARTPIRTAVKDFLGKASSAISSASRTVPYQGTTWAMRNVVTPLCDLPRRTSYSRRELHTAMAIIPLCLTALVGSTYLFFIGECNPIKEVYQATQQSMQKRAAQQSSDGRDEYGDYIVRPGDSLSKIASVQCQNRDRWREIQQLNNLPRKILYPHERLRLPRNCGRR